ncbi:NUDIX hydrolase [Nocardioides gilvus]|uniref:NUDIX hydrolase n=1 Tax=Nocardioides gilvus TaxID=1735589 RepID=UPI000D7499EC|nr:NUDIX hydrolase [Nocardioides gilvus]
MPWTRPEPTPDIIAAGAVVVRKRNGGYEVVLVHRPRYDDWSMPKGKLDPGEHVTACAVREVREETGLRVRLGVPLADQRYRVAGLRRKTVHYWMARVRGDDDLSGYKPNHEVDAVEWVPFDDALHRLTYRRDRAVLAEARADLRRSQVLVVLRHAHAYPRKKWDRDDRLRPLLDEGHAQAAALVPVLQAYGVSDLLSSTSTRCLQTLEPYASAAGLEVVRDPALSEEDVDAARIAELLGARTAGARASVVCSHRPVLPLLFETLGLEPRRLEPSAMVVVHHRGGEVLAREAWPVTPE